MPSPVPMKNLFFPTAAIATIFVAAASGIARSFRARRALRHQRRALRQLRGLNEHILRDIGFDRPKIASVVKHGREGR